MAHPFQMLYLAPQLLSLPENLALDILIQNLLGKLLLQSNLIYYEFQLR